MTFLVPLYLGGVSEKYARSGCSSGWPESRNEAQNVDEVVNKTEHPMKLKTEAIAAVVIDRARCLLLEYFT